MRYGFSYQGSKNQIAKDIIDVLPSGKRFVDLFGGGFAMSDCALKSNKYDSVLYNEINPLCCELVKKALTGYYNYDRFIPEWVSREEFHKNKNKDGYIKYIWSFNNNGEDYLYSKKKENIKKEEHNYCVHGTPLSFLPNLPVCGNTINERLKFLKKSLKENVHLPEINQVERLQEIERINALQITDYRLQITDYRLQITDDTYLNYKYQEGDVVYCDPPYENVKGYLESDFNHKEFYDWVATRPFKVYFSSYDNISDKRFKKIWQKEKRILFDNTNKPKYKLECLYTNEKSID